YPDIESGADTSTNTKIPVMKADYDWLTDQGREENRAIVSFIDDDCREEVYTILYDVIKSEQIPYTLACPPDSLGKEDYMTEDQLLDMVEYGVEVASHHLVQRNMEIGNFKTTDDYEVELEKCDQRFFDMGISAETICYPQGVYLSSYIPTVKKNYKAGFTINRGINYAPYNTYTLKRCEVFPKDGSKTIEDAKRLVDEAVETGGWLIFMTHAWYPSFQKEKLRDLIQYAKKQKIDILSVHEALKRSGNIIEIGNTEFEEAKRNAPFFVTSATGESRTNSLKIYDSFVEKISDVKVQYGTKNVLKKAGGVVESKDITRTVSWPAEVQEGEELYITGCAAWGNCVYVFYDETGEVLKDSKGDPREDAYLASDTSGKDLILVDRKITVPKGARSIRVASCTSVQTNGFKIARTEKSVTEASGLVFVKRDGTEVAITAEQIEKLLKLIE
ncbi:MAG: polysaccharide deacetylase family protein, partial [Dorea sp.]|nr:polysaccharide deacetylase family protein [Dorea sp.]